MSTYQSRPMQYQTPIASGGAGHDIYSEDYDWVINKLRARGFKTLQDRRAEAEEQRKQRLAAWEAEKERRRAAGEQMEQSGDVEKNPSWWKELSNLPGSEKKGPDGDEKPFDLMTEEEKEEKKIRDKWGGTLAESVPISDLKMLNTKGYIPRSQATCFRCGEKGHWSRDCPQSAKNQMQQRGEDEGILNRNRSELRGRDARMYDKALMEKRERAHYNR